MNFAFILLVSLIIVYNFVFKYNNNINILIGNSFYKYYLLPNYSLKCMYRNIKYKCKYQKNKNKIKYNAVIYNGNRIMPLYSISTYNIVMTLEKLSQVMFMKSISEGKNKYYHLAVDYRLFNNRWHISLPRFSNILHFLYTSKINFESLNSFMERKNNIVYIQRVHYKNRQFIVREIMKYLEVDSYGTDMNNRNWPYNMPRKNKTDILKKYKFCLAIENSVITWNRGKKYEADSINNDYFTEKLLDCFMAGCIPIYFGPKNINSSLPSPDSIINLSSFKSINDLVKYINIIKDNVTLIARHFKWHNNYSKKWYYKFKYNFTFSYCKICNYVKKYSNASFLINNN